MIERPPPSLSSGRDLAPDADVAPGVVRERASQGGRELLTFRLPREVDVTNKALVRTDLMAGIDERAPHIDVVIFDMTHTKFIDSGGLRALLAARNRAAESEARTCVVSPSAEVRRFVDLMDVAGHIPAFDSVNAALASRSAHFDPTGIAADPEPNPLA